jgi:hypothetical protein
MRPRRRDVVMTTLVMWALLESVWIVWLGFHLPQHYVADHWDAAWLGLDGAQLLMVVGCAWAAWRRHGSLIFFSISAAMLLLVDAWFDVLTSRYPELDQSLALLAFEVPAALFLLWVARRAYLLATRRTSAASEPVPEPQ